MPIRAHGNSRDRLAQSRAADRSGSAMADYVGSAFESEKPKADAYPLGKLCEWQWHSGRRCCSNRTRQSAVDQKWYCLTHMKELFFIKQKKEREERMRLASKL